MATKKQKPIEKFYETLAPAQRASNLWEDALTGSIVTWHTRVRPWLGHAGPELRARSAAAGASAWRGLRSLTSRKALWRYVAIIGLAAGMSAGALAYVGVKTIDAYSASINNPTALINYKDTGTTLLDRNGQVLYRTDGAPDRVIMNQAQTPQVLKDATLAAEDPGFYSHPAVSWRGTARALVQDAMNHDKSEGGSTITQQLIKSSLLSPDKSYLRKYKEIVLATDLQQKYSKDQVLQMYLNQVYYGQGAYGAATAAKIYFHESPQQLTVAQSAMIAGLALGPSRFDPTTEHQAALDRRNYVISQMEAHHFISDAQADAATVEPLVAYQQNVQINAPHFVFYVLDQLRQQYGDDLVEHGGITVTTTLDLNKQNIAQQVASAQIAKLAPNHVSNAAVVSMDPSNGDILTMLGSVDYNQPDWGQVNATESQLQPGSSFKPIAYVTAFSKGWSGATTVQDTPTCFPDGQGGAPYCPVNYDGKFRGTVTLRRALANSLNVPSVKVLQYAGIPDTIAMAHKLGITSLNDPNRYGLSLVLGGGEVSPLDMATVYSTFATGGIKHQPRSILKVVDRSGKNITKPSNAGGQNVLDPRLAYMITNILSDNQARVEEFGVGSPLQLDRPDAAKTGTTNDFRDNWTIGYTPNLVTAVWVGNDDHSPMNNVSGITGAAPIWHNYMEQVLKGTPVEQFTQPAGIVTARVCSYDGGLTGASSPGYNEVFLAENVETRKCGFIPPPPQPAQPSNPTPTDQGQGSDNGNGNEPNPSPPNPSPTPPGKHGNPFGQ